MNENKSIKNDDSDSDKILVSFYISGETFERIEELLFYLKRQFPLEKRRKLTKSIFYETGMKLLLEDYNMKGKESLLYKSIHELMQY